MPGGGDRNGDQMPSWMGEDQFSLREETFQSEGAGKKFIIEMAGISTACTAYPSLMTEIYAGLKKMPLVIHLRKV